MDIQRAKFAADLRDLINRHSLENGSNTPDFMLADYLTDCLEAYGRITQAREKWYGRGSVEVTTPEGPETATAAK